MGKEYGQTPSQLLGQPRTIDALALDEAVFWASRAEEITNDTRRTVHRNQMNARKTKEGGRR